MKILIVLFILYVHFCTSQRPELMKKTVSLYPKKVRSGIIQYNNAGNYFKSMIRTVKTNKPNSTPYTVFAMPFPTLEENKALRQMVPDSPYFPVDEPKQSERRPRVKKVLSDYPFPVRHKRSAVENGDDREKNMKVPFSSSSKTQNVAKKISPAKKSVNAEGRAKKFKAPVKGNGRPAKTQRQVNHDGKKGGQKKRPSQTGAKTQKVKALQKNKKRVPGNERLNQKLFPPRPGRSKNLKTSQKKLSKTALAERKLKAGQPQRGVKRLRNKNAKRPTQGHRNNTSKLRGARHFKDRNARRLIAARDAQIEEFPYTISIQKDGDHWCSGAILNPRMIITTANCLWRSSSISRMRVRVGSRYTDRGGQVAKIQEVMKHPGWKLRKNPDNDVALALLDRNIRFSHGVHNVDLPNRAMYPPFDDAWVTSWGAERRDGMFDTRSVNLQAYHARLIDHEKCNNITQRFAVSVSDSFICLSQTGTRAPCTRDTGAPAVSDGVLWGLASWGIRKLCGTERFPAMFSYMGSQSNMDFIINATHFLMSEERNYPYLDRYPVKKISVTTSTLMTLPYKR